MTSHSSYARRLRAFMDRCFAPYRRLSRAQVELAGTRVLERLRAEPMWESDAPLFDQAAVRPAKRFPRVVVLPAAAALVLARLVCPRQFACQAADARAGRAAAHRRAQPASSPRPPPLRGPPRRRCAKPQGDGARNRRRAMESGPRQPEGVTRPERSGRRPSSLLRKHVPADS